MMTNNQSVFPVTESHQTNNDLQLQQGLLWEFYKTWVSTQTELDGVAQGAEMFGLYQRLSSLLNAGLNPDKHNFLNEKTILKFAERHFTSVINFITDVVAPEKIFCLNHWVDAEGKDHADLLLVIPDKSSKIFDEIEKVIDFACLKHHHLSCSLFKASFFQQMIYEGHIYFSLACNKDELIYDNGASALPALKQEGHQKRVVQTKTEFYAGLEKARSFYSAAENCRSGSLTMGAFMLHQAAELCLRALTKSLTGQDKTTHSIRALLKFSLRITTRLTTLMNCGEAEDERLMGVLEAAYLGYRYTEKYTVSEGDLNVFFERVKVLHRHTEEAFLDWLAKYEELISHT
uniref:HEPN domain-containing protein n=1 Tax=Pedobacter schmidteae TaxID=2201271 RepID=UPI000EB008B8|nr:HEPN domain-containing protein [Pedobacter schmidteae]